MQPIIIGTAGHIDHGKTTLIRALTGRSTDTLREEQKRGISINLGFTYFDLPNGLRAGIIDVPGHERFIRNMLAGAMGIDLVLLTVAANEGVMPQTIEHVDILEFLDIKARVIVLTKCGTVDDDMRELAVEDIRDRLADTAFAGARMIAVDSLTGEGLDELVDVIASEATACAARNRYAAARLPVDRVFSLKGFGTIVTGTLWEGSISAGDELMLYPQGLTARVRSVQVHEQSAKTAYAGQRAALNLPDLSVGELGRGDVLAAVGSITPSAVIDARIRLVPHTQRRLGMWDRLRVYMGAREVMARLVPLDGNGVEAGGECYCQLRLERPVAVKAKDRLILRFYSPMETIGGGVVLDPNPPRHARLDPKTLEFLRLKEQGGLDDLIEGVVRERGEDGTETKAIADYAARTPDEITAALDGLFACGAVVTMAGRLYHADNLQAVTDAVLTCLTAFHEKNPLKPGMGREEVRRRSKTALATKAFSELLGRMRDDGLIAMPNPADIALAGYHVRLTPEQQRLFDALEKEYIDAGFTPPPLREPGRDKRYDQVMELLLSERLVLLDRQTALHREHYAHAKALALGCLRETGELKLAEFRDLLGCSRKYAMLILEDFDRKKLTIRDGEVRRPGVAADEYVML